MSIQTYGIVGVPNVTVTMTTQTHEDKMLSVNDAGEALPEPAVIKRKLSFDKERLRRHVVGKDDVSAELPGIFPIN